jgi:hypothetical protein
MELNFVGVQATSYHNLNSGNKIFYMPSPKLILTWMWGFVSTYFCSCLFKCTEYEIHGSFKMLWGRKEYSNIAKVGWSLLIHVLIRILPTHIHTQWNSSFTINCKKSNICGVWHLQNKFSDITISQQGVSLMFQVRFLQPDKKNCIPFLYSWHNHERLGMVLITCCNWNICWSYFKVPNTIRDILPPPLCSYWLWGPPNLLLNGYCGLLPQR